MSEYIKTLRDNLSFKLIVSVGLILLLTIATWAYFSIQYQRKRFKEEAVAQAERLSNTIMLSTHYAMMLNSRDDINQTIQNIARQRDIQNIRIYNKEGQIKFSNRFSEVDQTTNIKAEACYICHKSDPPISDAGLNERTRIFDSAAGYRLLGIISPICNEPSCSANDCHIHPEGKKILGALDVVVSLEESDREILFFQQGIIGMAAGVFLVTSAIIFIFIMRFVNRPIKRLIDGTHAISRGEYATKIKVNQGNEMGQLAAAINRMSAEIGEKQAELNRQRDMYQSLFETVPCIITVQDRSYKLVGYNREFASRFDPKPDDYCYAAYKGRTLKCINCPVEKTFEDGQSHYSEEAGISKDGTPTYWIVKTSPIRNPEGEIVAAMEMSLDITHRRQLEDQLEQSEKKYHDIFNNIPNPTFVLDAETLAILDCNESVKAVYGYVRDEIINRSFLDLFPEEERDRYASNLKSSSILTQAKHLNSRGKQIFVTIRISPAEYPGKKVLLVTTSDITKRLETEQQLIQASKMATLGEMATGVAHELNQPLAVIKTASSFFMKKIRKKERIEDEILFTMANEVDSHVDRATKIINHMREFGRKSDMDLECVCLSDVLQRAYEIFSQQLKVRGIETIWNLGENLPYVMADPDRLEQVFINLLINARDAIEEKCQSAVAQSADRRIIFRTYREGHSVCAEIEDTGTGISQDILGKIFEPFFTTKAVGRGTGLGLSISYQIIQDFGGSIQAVPINGKGTCFCIRLPAADNPEA